MNKPYDVVIIGAGIVGLATAMKLAMAYPSLRIAVSEKESRPACHQSGHNSGVIHSGIYYRPGSLKASMCVSGARELIQFCRAHAVPYELCGKVVVATGTNEIPRLQELWRRGTANGVQGLRMLEPRELRTLEPHVRALVGMHVPSTGIVDFARVARAYATKFEAVGGRILLNHRVGAIQSEPSAIRIETNQGILQARAIINCAGLYADHVARMGGATLPCRIVPFRGEYYQLRTESSHLVKNLIYPVPDPRFPFLGVHFTRMIDGKVEAGPNAVLAWAREGYRKRDMNLPELHETFGYRGFWRLLARYWRPAWGELLRSHVKSRFTLALQHLIPEIREQDLVPGAAGVRAQALAEDGTLLDDFVILQHEKMVHVLNAPSPAATSSLAIADHIVGVAAGVIA